MSFTPNKRMVAVALAVVGLDQFTKLLVLRLLGYTQERVVIDGFFKFVHWGNTGAAWSLFRDHNSLLAIISLVALVVLYVTRHHFHAGTLGGKIALGLLFGGIIGNLIDRVTRHQVIDFIYFYINQRGGGEIGFPAFNVADSSICISVGLLFLLSWQREEPRQT
ncbi:MAG: signal peptidase II [Verrucomicrobiales bacterium]|nr:signal peptidase II [Verrucomicrobiales bacterium]